MYILVNLHIGIIIDGQRKWAKKKRGRSHIDGYFVALERLFEWMFESDKVNAITILDIDKEKLLTKNYCNNNPEFLRRLTEFFEKYSEELMQNGWNVRVLGYLNSIDERIKKLMIDLESLNSPDNEKCLQICVNYSGRNEIIRAMRLLRRRDLNITMDNFENCLDSASEIDLVLRTGNSYQLKQFLIWQAADSYVYFSKKLWPEINNKDLDKALKFYWDQKKELQG